MFLRVSPYKSCLYIDAVINIITSVQWETTFHLHPCYDYIYEAVYGEGAACRHIYSDNQYRTLLNATCGCGGFIVSERV